MEDDIKDEDIQVPEAPEPAPPLDPAVISEAEKAKDEANTNFKGEGFV